MSEEVKQNIIYGGISLTLVLLMLWGVVSWRSAPAQGVVRVSEAREARESKNNHRRYDAESSRSRLRELAGDYTSPKEQHEAQMRLRKALLEMDKKEAVGLILEYFESGVDQNFQLPFKVGKGGVLVAAPTMRVLLLDILGKLDSKQARGLAEKILESMISADEWAVSLRNVVWDARGERQEYKPSDLAYVKGKLNEMFSHEPWLEAPSNGFLESFDFWVEMGDRESMKAVLDLRSKQKNKDVKNAAWIATHQLIARDSAMAINYLVEPAQQAKLSQLSLATLIAKADPRDEKQMDAVQKVLESRAIDDLLVVNFFRYFPNFQGYVVPRLVSAKPAPLAQSAKRRSLVALETLDKWVSSENMRKHERFIHKTSLYLRKSLYTQ